jgi:5-methylcytosine-specific restriction endonuclease McrA
VCDKCRSNHEKIDGTRWRKLRAKVLAEMPVCVVAGCGRLSTSVDHIVALSRGGDPYDRRNLQAMCATHNSSKGDRPDIAPPQWCTHPLCREPETCPGAEARWHL